MSKILLNLCELIEIRLLFFSSSILILFSLLNEFGFMMHFLYRRLLLTGNTVFVIIVLVLILFDQFITQTIVFSRPDRCLSFHFKCLINLYINFCHFSSLTFSKCLFLISFSWDPVFRGSELLRKRNLVKLIIFFHLKLGLEVYWSSYFASSRGDSLLCPKLLFIKDFVEVLIELYVFVHIKCIQFSESKVRT